MSTFDYGSNFNPGYYLQTNPDVKAAGVDPLQHYLQFGWHEGRNPNPYFDVSDYESQYGDVKSAGVEPLQHYLQFGKTEGRNPFAATSSPIFDPDYYLAQNPDVAKAGVDPLQHYQQFGYKEFRDPSASFDVSDYFRLYPDVAQAGVEPFAHYQTFGAGEGRHFDPSGFDAGQPNPPVGGPSNPTTPTTPGKTREQAAAAGRGDIRTYFTGRNVNPDKYNTDIENRIASILSGVTSYDDPNLFTGVAQNLYGGLQDTYRQNALKAFDKAVPANPFNSAFDDPIIESIISEQRTPADRLISNMLARGQIDDFGAERARNELDRQASTGRKSLNELGGTYLDPQKGSFATDIANRRTTVGNVGLDQAYDTTFPSTSTASNDFGFSLGNNLRQGAGNIFSTANLPSIAGASTGAFGTPNTPFKSRGGGGRTPGGGFDPNDDTNILF